LPRTKTQNEKIREERRRTILDVAVVLFAEKGYSQTTVSAIAKKAGVSHGSVFQYFPTKEALFHASITGPLEYAHEHFQHYRHLQASPLDRIRQMVSEQVRAFVSQTSYLRLVQYVIGQRHRFPELEDALQHFSRLYSDLLVPIIREGQQLGELSSGTPETIAFSYFAYLNGVGLTITGESDEHFLEELIENGIRIFGPLKPQ
jgi:AcrR family transcriptional regulator